MKKLQDYVVSVYDDFVEVICRNDLCQKRLAKLGAEKRLKHGNRWVLRFTCQEDLAKVLKSLRELNFAFARSDSGSCPAGIYECLREKGLLEGKFVELLSEGGKKTTTER
jgi:hypothetical protein